MLTYIVFIFLLLLVFLPMILMSIARGVLSLFSFKFWKRNWQQRETNHRSDASYSRNEVNDIKQSNRKHKKIFDKTDGEYVDFEEIK